ncbi:MAG: hypothetical protein ACLTBV_09130 [Enterocloster bolteae]
MVLLCYNEQETVPIFYKIRRSEAEILVIEFEYWFIDDGSSDDTLKKMMSLHSQKNVYVHYISFSRKFWEGGRFVGRPKKCG